MHFQIYYAFLDYINNLLNLSLALVCFQHPMDQRRRFCPKFDVNGQRKETSDPLVGCWLQKRAVVINPGTWNESRDRVYAH